jgi:hypothetical protein
MKIYGSAQYQKLMNARRLRDVKRVQLIVTKIAV